MKITSFTNPTLRAQIQRSWYLFDVKNKIVGRVAVDIAKTLMGKATPQFTRSLDCGNHVVVINAAHVRMTGKKENTKMYSHYSGYPGGLKQKTFAVVKDEKPTEIIRHAVWGMLPKNKLRHRLITRLYIFADDNHPYKDKVQVNTL